MERRAVGEYLERDAPVIERRRERWGTWTASADALRERQRRSRLIRNTRPREPATAFDDSLELADRALEHLHRIKRGLPGTSPVHPSVEECAELIRMLAWGPEDQGSRPCT